MNDLFLFVANCTLIGNDGLIDKPTLALSLGTCYWFNFSWVIVKVRSLFSVSRFPTLEGWGCRNPIVSVSYVKQERYFPVENAIRWFHSSVRSLPYEIPVSSKKEFCETDWIESLNSLGGVLE